MGAASAQQDKAEAEGQQQGAARFGHDDGEGAVGVEAAPIPGESEGAEVRQVQGVAQVRTAAGQVVKLGGQSVPVEQLPGRAGGPCVRRDGQVALQLQQCAIEDRGALVGPLG